MVSMEIHYKKELLWSKFICASFSDNITMITMFKKISHPIFQDIVLFLQCHRKCGFSHLPCKAQRNIPIVFWQKEIPNISTYKKVCHVINFQNFSLILYLYPMTLVLILDPDVVNNSTIPKMKFLCQVIQKLQPITFLFSNHKT